jgi:hypothetical protein
MTIGSYTGKIAAVVLEAGSWEDGDAEGVLMFEPDSTGTVNDGSFLTIIEDDGIVNDTQAITDATFQAHLSRSRNKGHLWRADLGGWNWVDPGYSVRFKTGTNPPLAQVAPLFLPSIAGVTSAVQDTGFVMVSAAAAVGDTGTYSAFSSVTNLYADDAAVASSAISANGLSQLIEAYDTDFIDAEDTEIIGIEVQVEASQTVGTDAYIASLRIINDATGAIQYQSDDVADNQELTTTPTVYSFGGQTDLWGMETLTAEDFNSGDIKVQIQFGNGNGSTVRTVEVDYLQVKVHYIARGQTVYFYDTVTSADVTSGSIYAFEKHDGDWTPSSDATGYMTLHDIVSPKAVVAGLQVRTAAAGAGDLIAVTAGDITRNLLPSEAEMDTEGSKYRVIEANFYQNDEGKGIYGATGASPAFLCDEDDHFAFIRTPVARRKDKPRHVAFHANHLVLGLESGHILVSAVDVPNDFDTSSTATAWPFRDPITGLMPLTGNALGVMCRESVNALLGTTGTTGESESFRTQNITPKSGAVEYTMADVFGPMYADYGGIGTVQSSERFGNFDPGRLTAAIDNWARDRFQRKPSTELFEKGPVLGVPVRAKNQYRIYFADGYILSLYVGDTDQPAQPMFSHMDPTNLTDTYVPYWIDSSILSTGKERVVMGDKNGNVWIVDGANGIQTAGGLTEVDSYITINPINTGYPQGSHNTYFVTVMGDFYGAQTIATSIGYDYLDVTSTPRTKVIGSYDAAPLFEPVTDYTDVFTQALTDGFSMKIKTSLDGSKPHTLHSLIHRFSRKGSNRNNTGKGRG